MELFAFEEPKKFRGDNTSGTGGPIPPTGGDPPGPVPFPHIHRFGLLKKAKPSSAIIFASLSDLRLRLPKGGSPKGVRIAIYSGPTPGPAPEFLDQTAFEPVAGSTDTFRISDIVSAAVQEHLILGNLVGLEIPCRTGTIGITSIRTFSTSKSSRSSKRSRAAAAVA